MLKVAFICTHNSCRSQIAEAFERHLCGDVFESYSAGTSKKDQINPDAVRLMKEKYGIDMVQEGQHPKELETLPPGNCSEPLGFTAIQSRHFRQMQPLMPYRH